MFESDDEYLPMSEDDFKYDQNDPRLTRVISPKKIQPLLGVDAISEALSSISMMEEESGSEDDGQVADKKKDIEPVKSTNMKRGKRNVAVVKPTTKNSDAKMPSRNTKQKKPKATKGKKTPKVEDSEEEYYSEDCPFTSSKQSSPELGYEKILEVNRAPEQKVSHTTDDDQTAVQEEEIYDSKNVRAGAVENTKKSRAQGKKALKEIAKGEDEVSGDENAQASSGINKKPSRVQAKKASKQIAMEEGEACEDLNIKANFVNKKPTRVQTMKPSKQTTIEEDDISGEENVQADAVVNKKPSRATQNKTAKQTTKVSKKPGKTDEFVGRFFKESDNMPIENMNNGKEVDGITTTEKAASESEKEENNQIEVKRNLKVKSSRREKKDKPKTQEPLDMPEDIYTKTDENQVQKLLPEFSHSNEVLKEKEPEDETNKVSENYETSPDNKAKRKPARAKMLGKKDPIDPSSVNENKKTQKSKQLQKIESDQNKLVVDDTVAPPEKGKQKNLRKGANPKEKQPLKDLNTAEEENLDLKQKNVKAVAQEGIIQNENDGSVPKTKPAPKKRNVKVLSSLETNTVDNEPTDMIATKAKNVRTNAKKVEIDKEEKKVPKTRKAATTAETVPEETTTKRTLRNRK